jgi:hypothetical protein
MTKRQLIDEILELNPTAGPEFLCAFEPTELKEYLDHLHWVHPDSAGRTPSHSREQAAADTPAPPTGPTGVPEGPDGQPMRQPLSGKYVVVDDVPAQAASPFAGSFWSRDGQPSLF